MVGQDTRHGRRCCPRACSRSSAVLVGGDSDDSDDDVDKDSLAAFGLVRRQTLRQMRNLIRMIPYADFGGGSCA